MNRTITKQSEINERYALRFWCSAVRFMQCYAQTLKSYADFPCSFPALTETYAEVLGNTAQSPGRFLLFTETYAEFLGKCAGFPETYPKIPETYALFRGACLLASYCSISFTYNKLKMLVLYTDTSPPAKIDLRNSEDGFPDEPIL